MTFDTIAFLCEAVQIQSHDDVTEMRAFVVDCLEQEGHSPEIDQQGNVLATRDSGEPTDSHIVLNTHIDTVPPQLPFEQHQDSIHGRGACDAKGSLACLLKAFLSATVSSGKLTLAISPNEETSQLGGAYLGETLDADGYIVGEPTGLDVCPAARGNFGGRITIYGESAHASDPTAGVNPITVLPIVLDALNSYDEHRGPGRHDLLGSPTLTPTHIEAGGTRNQIPDECTVSFDRRTVPPETIDTFVPDLRDYLQDRLPSHSEFAVKPAYPESPDPDAFATDTDSALVNTLVSKSGGKIRPFEAATEASYFAQNAPTVVFGPGVLADDDGPVAHSNREYVEIAAVTTGAEIVIKTIEAFVG